MNKMPNNTLKRKICGFDLETANFIVAMFQTDFYSVADVCRTVGIGRTTFYNWIKQHPDFQTAIENAKQDLRDRMKSKAHARNSLMRRLTGFEITERKVITEPGNEIDADGTPIPVIKAIVERTRHIPPDTKAIIFVLTNMDSKHWKNGKCIEVKKSTQDNECANLSDEELQLMIDRLGKHLVESKPTV